MTRYLLIIISLIFVFGCSAAANKSAVAEKNTASASMPEAAVAPAAAEPVAAKKDVNVAPEAASQRKEVFTSDKAFLTENLKKEGVKVLPGGVQYRVIKAGSGVSPTLGDTVDISFTTARSNGKVIATTGSDTPRTYQLRKVMPDLRRALLQMKPGARWEIVVPPSNRNQLTETGGALIYQLELVAVHPANG